MLLAVRPRHSARPCPRRPNAQMCRCQLKASHGFPSTHNALANTGRVSENTSVFRMQIKCRDLSPALGAKEFDRT